MRPQFLAALAVFVVACADKNGLEWEGERRVAGVIVPGAQLVLDDAGIPAMSQGWTPLQWPGDSTACPGTHVAARARGDTAYAAWWRLNSYGYGDLFIARTDDGVHWLPGTLMGGAVASDRVCFRPPPGLAVDPVTGAVFIAWHGMSNFGPAIMVIEAASTARPGALAFFVDSAAPAARMTSVSARGDTVAVAFEKNTESGTEVRLALSLSRGHIPVVRGSVSPVGTRAFAPLVALRDGRVAVAWNEGRRDGAPPAAAARVGKILR
jgi:hypothetical protein